jgi:hypothetical protein
MYRKAMLRPLDLYQLVLGPELPNRGARRLDGHERVLGAVHDERRSLDLAKHQVRRKPEDLVEQCPAMLKGWRELNVALLGQLAGLFIVQLVVRPVIPSRLSMVRNL